VLGPSAGEDARGTAGEDARATNTAVVMARFKAKPLSPSEPVETELEELEKPEEPRNRETEELRGTASQGTG
jgi:hypothetical protein